MLELDLRVEHPPLVELVADVDDRPQEVEHVSEAGRLAALAFARVALEDHLTVAADRQAFLHAVDLRGGDAQAVETLRILGAFRRRLAERQLLDLFGQDLDPSFQFGDAIVPALGGQLRDGLAQFGYLLFQCVEAVLRWLLGDRRSARQDHRQSRDEKALSFHGRG